jgi:hypothetical protein
MVTCDPGQIGEMERWSRLAVIKDLPMLTPARHGQIHGYFLGPPGSSALLR